MTEAINLMSEQAVRRVAARRRTKAWTVAIAAVACGLSAAAAREWVAYRRIAGDYEALEARYEPTRRLNLANQALRTEATQLVTKDRTPLQLARIAPPEQLLEIVSRAVATCDGAAYVSHVVLNAEPASSNGRIGAGRMQLELVGRLDADLDPLLAALRTAPITEAKVVSSEIVASDAGQRKTAVIECRY